VWIKLLKLAVVAAKATGLDQKIKGWAKKKLEAAAKKVTKKAADKLAEAKKATDILDKTEE